MSLIWAPAAQALIMATTPLKALMDDATLIVTARVEMLDPTRPAMMLAIDEALKGKASFARVPVAIQVDEDVRAKQVPQFLRRLAVKVPLVVFVSKKEKDYIAFAYSNGSWFQMTGTETDDGPRWKVTHFEPYLRKSFKGTTAELQQVLADVLAGKRKAPPPDAKEKPDIGPELDSKPKEPEEKKPGLVQRRDSDTDGRQRLFAPLHRGPPMGVIPTVGVLAPVAFLAMLFPAVFGGLMLVLKRWMAALTVLSLNSTLYLVYLYFGPLLPSAWWTTPLALWLTMLAITLVGLWWAWSRHLRRVAAESTSPAGTEPLAEAGATGITPNPGSHAPAAAHPARPAFQPPGVGEVWTLAVASLVCVVLVLWTRPGTVADLSLGGKTLWAFSAGLVFTTLYTACVRLIAAHRFAAAPALPGEGVLLWAMTAAGAALGGTFAPQPPSAPPSDDGSAFQVVWQFRVPVERGWIASSPRIDGDRVYIAAVHPNAFRPGGALYCVDRATGALVWSFNNDGKMKDPFSSPCIVDGRVYIGEGFHQHEKCKVYCLDAASGKKVWEFTTGSHTESSPAVVQGKVYIGAGDDGLYCLDAADGKEKWHMQGLHVDAPPLVVGGRVYGGSGVGDVYRETMVFCVDAEKGTDVWPRMPTDLPVWAMPVLDGDRLFVGLGNGNFVDSADQPAGAVLAINAGTGQRVWRCDVPDGVFGRPAVDADAVYFGCRDGFAYAADRKEGKVKWKTDLLGPIVASPALVDVGKEKRLYVAATGGRVARLDPADGEVIGTFDIAAETKAEVLAYSSPLVTQFGGRVLLFVGCGLDDHSRGILYCVEDRTSLQR
jgi:outer membrane protein assembly factor BamB